jgi:hypothetical protein
MTFDNLIRAFGTVKKIAAALEMKYHTVYSWEKNGIPKKHWDLIASRMPKETPTE